MNPQQNRGSAAGGAMHAGAYARANQSFYNRAPDEAPPTLTGISRDSFVQLIRRVARDLPCPVGVPALNTFAIMTSVTRISDWTTPGAEPMCYMAQTQIAEIAGCSPGRVRAHEAELVAAGLIEKRTLGNGGRSGWRERGIYFTPAIERLEEFRAIQALMDEQRQAAARLRGLRSTHRSILKATLTELSVVLGEDHEDVQRLSEAFSAWPRADKLHHLSLQALAIHEAQADQLCREAVEILENLQDSHGQPCENERSHIQDTTISPDSEKCNASVSIRPADTSADRNSTDTPPNGDVNCLESKYEPERPANKSEFLEKLGPERLYALASTEMQLHLDGRRYRNGALTFHDFAIAAQNRLPELGINASAWTEAVREMGEDTATMCVLVLDASRDRPGLPVANPGGYLRGMTRAAQAGQLNIIGSLIGLSERKRADF